MDGVDDASPDCSSPEYENRVVQVFFSAPKGPLRIVNVGEKDKEQDEEVMEELEVTEQPPTQSDENGNKDKPAAEADTGIDEATPKDTEPIISPIMEQVRGAIIADDPFSDDDEDDDEEDLHSHPEPNMQDLGMARIHPIEERTENVFERTSGLFNDFSVEMGEEAEDEDEEEEEEDWRTVVAVSERRGRRGGEESDDETEGWRTAAEDEE